MSKAQILSLYQQLIRESKKFDSYNYRWVFCCYWLFWCKQSAYIWSFCFHGNFIFFIRNYALRRIRDAFKENKQLADKAAIQEQIDYGKKNLDIIRRQVNKISYRNDTNWGYTL